MEKLETETSRRGLLRLTAKALIGVRSVEYLIPLVIGAELIVDQVPGQKSGNAGFEEEIIQNCETKHPTNKEECQDPTKNFDPSAEDLLMGVVIAPPVEEALFRALPSTVMNVTSGKHREEAGQTLGLSRREWIVGGITSVLFGAAHNFTDKGFDTKTIPAAQITMGLGFWRLQRREGYVANTSAHMALNGIALGVAKIASYFR